MIRTDNFVRALSDKGLVDDAMFLDSGYDIQYKGNIVSVRLNDKGGAVIFNQKKNDLVEIQSARLDEVLHKYIFQSLFGLQNKIGTREMDCKNVAFVPTKVVRNSVIFEDNTGRKFTMSGNSPKAVLSYYKEACNINADDCMLLLNNFVAYNPAKEYVSSSVETPEIELQILKSAVNMEDYAVSPKIDCINDVGQTIVGNFLCSASDKWNLITFEEDQNNAFNFSSVSKRISSNALRTKNPLVLKAKDLLSSNKQAVSKYVEDKYPHGLCVSAMQNMLAYETPSLCKEANVENTINYGFVFNNLLQNADKVRFRLDNNKSILCAVEKEGVSVAKFRAVPVLSELKDPLTKNGYFLTELESGLEFNAMDTTVGIIASCCKSFVPVVENPVNVPNTVTKVIGSSAKETLMTYGINDVKGVFSSFYRVVLN